MASLLLNLKLFAPEATLVALLVVLFLVDAFVPSSRKNYLPLALVAVGCEV